MRKMFASAMLCLFLLLSVGTARCESRCASSSMPVGMSVSMENAAAPDSMAMDSAMEHCGGMRSASHTNLPDASAGCGQMNCRHEALPPSSEFRIAMDDAGLLAPVAMLVTEHAVVVAMRRVPDDLQVPPLPRLSPLEQTSLLRV